MICPVCKCRDFYTGPGSTVECPDCGAVIDAHTERLVIELPVQQAMSSIGTASRVSRVSHHAGWQPA